MASTVKYPDVTLLVQGPINEKTVFLDNIKEYKKLFKEIIVSTWETEFVTDEFVKECRSKGIRDVIKNPLALVDGLENKYNIAYQTVSTYYGLGWVFTPYVLKHRTDEKYSNLDKLVDKFMLDTNKWVSGSTVMGPKIYHIFHAADHLFIAKTEKLELCFARTLHDLRNGIFYKNSVGEPAAEVTFTTNFIRINGEEPTLERHDELMLKYFDFVNDREFYPFLIRFNHNNNKVYSELEHFHPCWLNYNTMDDMIHSRGGPMIC